MLFDIFRSGGDKFTIIVNLCVRVFVIFCILPIHEFAHALAADKLGDDTPRLKGRLTLAPMAHIDPWGALMIILCGFGYAKPVPVNMRNFKKKIKSKNGETISVYYPGQTSIYDAGYAKRCMAAVAFAGPAANLLVAFISLFIYFLSAKLGASSTLAHIIQLFLQYSCMINLNLAVFNLLPIPPLDGSRILFAVTPDKVYYKIMQYERYIRIAILMLLVIGVLSYPLSALSTLIFKGMSSLIRLILHIDVG